jgi:hypothetical protein
MFIGKKRRVRTKAEEKGRKERRKKERKKERKGTQDTIKHEMLNVTTTQIFTCSSYYAISTICINCMYIGEMLTESSHDSNGRVLIKFGIRSLYNK